MVSEKSDVQQLRFDDELRSLGPTAYTWKTLADLENRLRNGQPSLTSLEQRETIDRSRCDILQQTSFNVIEMQFYQGLMGVGFGNPSTGGILEKPFSEAKSSWDISDRMLPSETTARPATLDTDPLLRLQDAEQTMRESIKALYRKVAHEFSAAHLALQSHFRLWVLQKQESEIRYACTHFQQWTWEEFDSWSEILASRSRMAARSQTTINQPTTRNSLQLSVGKQLSVLAPTSPVFPALHLLQELVAPASISSASSFPALGILLDCQRPPLANDVKSQNQSRAEKPVETVRSSLWWTTESDVRRSRPNEAEHREALTKGMTPHKQQSALNSMERKGTEVDSPGKGALNTSNIPLKPVMVVESINAMVKSEEPVERERLVQTEQTSRRAMYAILQMLTDVQRTSVARKNDAVYRVLFTETAVRDTLVQQMQAELSFLLGVVRADLASIVESKTTNFPKPIIADSSAWPVLLKEFTEFHEMGQRQFILKTENAAWTQIASRVPPFFRQQLASGHLSATDRKAKSLWEVEESETAGRLFLEIQWQREAKQMLNTFRNRAGIGQRHHVIVVQTFARSIISQRLVAFRRSLQPNSVLTGARPVDRPYLPPLAYYGPAGMPQFTHPAYFPTPTGPVAYPFPYPPIPYPYLPLEAWQRFASVPPMMFQPQALAPPPPTESKVDAQTLMSTSAPPFWGPSGSGGEPSGSGNVNKTTLAGPPLVPVPPPWAMARAAYAPSYGIAPLLTSDPATGASMMVMQPQPPSVAPPATRRPPPRPSLPAIKQIHPPKVLRSKVDGSEVLDL